MNPEEEKLEEDTLAHYGTPRESGRYPWGSGENPHQRNRTFLQSEEAYRRKGMTPVQIARAMNISTTQLRARKRIAKNEVQKEDQARAMYLRDVQKMSNVAIGKEMGRNESSVRELLNPSRVAKADVLQNTADEIKKNVDKYGLLDIGVGVEHHVGVNRVQLQTAVAMLGEEGYGVHYINVQQQGTGKMTKLLVLSKPGTTYADIYQDPSKIHAIGSFTDDQGITFREAKPPVSIDSKRVFVRYGPDGGEKKDGTIELRRGVDDISLGGSQYAQVRIAVDDSHYLKGMALYADDIPDGYDMVFNTNKENKGDKLAALKPLQRDKETGEVNVEAPFGAIVKPKFYAKNGKEAQSPINIVNEEGRWDEWSKSLSSQVLSKQPVALAKAQLGKRYDAKKAEFDELNALTNPAVKKKLLESLADDIDSSVVTLKAAALPRQRTQVILPINTLRDTEVYAPNFRDGEKVALVRYPHGGKFEIPELTVNNKNPEANRVMKDARDAIGINSEVAGRLSGADFDGDTVLVIPNNLGKIKTAAPLAQLKGFNPQIDYKGYEGMPEMSPRSKQKQMGDVSNLITDMTIKGATQAELARAVRHSMVVIDAEKHKLNWRQSAKDHDISSLKTKYQGGPKNGASTLISQASSNDPVLERKAAPAAQGGAINKKTGERQYVETGNGYYNKEGEWVPKRDDSPKIANVDDARVLSSGTPMENTYADHANRLKALANEARKTLVNTPPIKYSSTANAIYKAEDRALTVKLNAALKNKPLERQAQLVAATLVKARQDANPDMDAADLKKVRGQALKDARERVGAAKKQIEILPREWEAIQSGAISNNKLVNILSNSDVDRLKELATPRATIALSTTDLARAQTLIRNGATAAEAADQLGISVSTLNSALYK
jgi:DNA-binding CsgD family transcriptional regulator